MAEVNGKAILFGEHFVAYQGKAIVSSIPLSLKIFLKKVSSPSKSSIVLNGKSFYNSTSEKIITHIFELLSIKDSLIISVESEIPLAAGLGSSSAFIVCLLKTLNEFYTLGMNLSEINNAAFSVERKISSIISGIDTTIITYSGILMFEQGKHKQLFLKKPFTLLLVNSRVSSSTPDILKTTRNYIHDNMQHFKKLVYQNNFIVDKACSALLSGDLPLLGKLMMQNHILLQQLGVSHPAIEEIIQIASSHGAYGAKVTGAGCGGYVIILNNHDSNQDNTLQNVLLNKGYSLQEVIIGQTVKTNQINGAFL